MGIINWIYNVRVQELVFKFKQYLRISPLDKKNNLFHVFHSKGRNAYQFFPLSLSITPTGIF